MKVDQLAVEIFASRPEMGAEAAFRVQQQIERLLQGQISLNIIFAAAPSQNEFLSALLAAPIDWSRIRAFHMDEYLGLDKEAAQGFGNFLRDRLFGKIPLLSVSYIDGTAPDPGKECTRYAALLKQYPPDIVCMGIGENGHIAFNDPPVADFNDPETVKVVQLDQLCRQQQLNDGCFANLPSVPTHAITLTVPALMAGRYIYCMVPGKLKATAVRNTLNEKISEACPATVLRRHPNAQLFLDTMSAECIEKKKMI